jgi:AcrR family transcriptional regulator
LPDAEGLVDLGAVEEDDEVLVEPGGETSFVNHVETNLVGDKFTICDNLATVKKPSRAPTQTSYHHGNLREALIEEAGKVLESQGADAISFRGLARALDVSHAAPGHHFADRHELLAELAADGYSGLADAMATGMESARPEEWLRASGKAYVHFGVANPERYRMMFASRFMTGECPDRLLVASSRAYLLLLRAAYGRDPDVDPAEYRIGVPELAAWSIVHGAVMLWIDGQLGPAMTEDDFLRLAEEMVSGLVA